MSVTRLRRWTVALWAVSFGFSVAVLVLMIALATGAVVDVSTGTFATLIAVMVIGLAVTVASLVLSWKYFRAARSDDRRQPAADQSPD